MKKVTSYDQYIDKVIRAQNSGISNQLIIDELQKELKRIGERCLQKCIELSGNRTPYPAREARRLATECTEVIKRIMKELSKGTPCLKQ